MSDNLVTLARYPTVTEAHLVRLRLAAEGIDTLVMEQDALRFHPLRDAPGAPIRLQIRAQDLEEARALLAALAIPDEPGAED